MRPHWVLPAIRAAYAAAKEIYLDASAAEELNNRYMEVTGVWGGYGLEEGRKFRLSFFRSPDDFIMYWETPDTSTECR
ncbi:hypothetical protein [Phaeobacter phage MD18]|nr:hypothetical protein [Phaeobacter phage MD18]